MNPAGVKGLGELGNVGTAAALSNAVFHATGRRLRELPIRLDQLLRGSCLRESRPPWDRRSAWAA